MRMIDRIDPRLKLIWCLVLLFTALLAHHILTEVAILLVILLTDLAFTRDLKKYKVLIVIFLIVASQIYVMQLLFGREGELIWKWWIISVYSGSIPAATLGTLRTVAVSFAAIQMICWTSAEDVVLMLRSWHVPYRYAMLVTMAQRFFPLLKGEYQSIVQSQAVRGVATDTVWQKIKVLPMTFLPFLYRAIRHTSEIALSMELRGFGRSKERTFMKDLHYRPAEIALSIALVLLFFVLNIVFHI